MTREHDSARAGAPDSESPQRETPEPSAPQSGASHDPRPATGARADAARCAALSCGRFRLALHRPLIMGVVNVTPDSFSDGGLHASARDAIALARRLVDEGADIVDIGGESTRPGAAPVGEDEELARVLPVLEAALALGVPVSVDTRRTATMRAALAAGADMINDIAGFRDAGAVDAVAGSNAALCVMHMLGDPSTMQQAPAYRDVVDEVRQFLAQRIRVLHDAGVAADRLVIDPGIGFGKTQEDNLSLLRSIGRFAAFGAPVLIGLSRKSLVGHLTGRPAGERVAGSVGGALAAVARGARIVRVHDVAATRDALAVWSAIAGNR